MIKTKHICILILSCLFSVSASAFFEETLRFLTGIELRNTTPAPNFASSPVDNRIQALARRLLLQMAPYFLVNYRELPDEAARLDELHRLLDERTFVPEHPISLDEIPAAPARSTAELVRAGEAGEAGARQELVQLLFVGLRDFEHLNARIRYAALYILAFNGWHEAAAQIEIIHHEGLLEQPRWPRQGDTLRMLFHVHHDALGSH